ncbi:MAG: FoF1 ATP synthase subunit gamma [Candidatus Omnitrophota bacterium]
MPTLKRIKEDLEFNQTLIELVEVLKSISSSQFQAMKGKKERFKVFIQSFEGFFRMIDLSEPRHPFATVGSDTIGIIMITSDEGFMGGLNTQVINSALEYRKKNPAELIVIGEKGAAYLENIGEKFSSFPGIKEENKYQLVIKLRDYVIKQKMAGRVGRVILSYLEPVSFTYQRVKIMNIFPCVEIFKKKKEETMREGKKIIIESSLNQIIEYLVATWITHVFFEIFEDSKISEFAARTISLEEKYQQLMRKEKILRHKYFYDFHRLIDRSMSNTFAAALLGRKRGMNNNG